MGFDTSRSPGLSELLSRSRAVSEVIRSVRVGDENSELYFLTSGTLPANPSGLLENGFAVTGQSAAASAENFDEEIGRKIARADAREKIWPLEGYLLRESLHLQGV